MVCHVCGTNNPEGNKFCEGCGVELKAAEAASTPVASTPAAAAPAAATAAPVVESTTVAAVSTAASSTPPAAEVPATPAAPSSDEATALKSTAEAPAESSPNITPVPAAPETPAATPVAIATEATPPAAPVAAPTAVSGPHLVARQYGATTSFVFPMTGQKLSVGRFDPSTGPVDLDLSNLPGKEHVSRRHAELFFENGKWMVRDLGSTNGVYVKKAAESQFGARIQAPVALEDGDEVAFGNVQFVFQQD